MSFTHSFHFKIPDKFQMFPNFHGPGFSTLFSDREQSFENWPKQIVQRPKDLIQNGFFYTGIGDHVTCFYCDVTLQQWDKTDCIETEHLKWESNARVTISSRNFLAKTML
jgi:hypothetical protein